MDWLIEVWATLKRGWKVLTAAGAVGGGTGVLAAFSPLADAAAFVFSVHGWQAKVIAGVLTGAIFTTITALAGTTSRGRRYSIHHVVDDEGSVYVIAEYRGLRDRELPLRMGIPPIKESQKNQIWVEPIIVAATNGLTAEFIDKDGKVSHSLPTQVRDVWTGKARFSGAHEGPFDLVVIVRNHRSCALTLQEHHEKWAEKTDFDDTEVEALTDWDEIEIRQYWTREPELRGDPLVVHHYPKKDGKETKPPKEKELDSNSRGMWCVTMRNVKRAERVQIRWNLGNVRPSGRPARTHEQQRTSEKHAIAKQPESLPKKDGSDPPPNASGAV